ncbi:MAG TPA: hypothetical protein VMN58_11520 [Acidimicrobiales bacterium]|nr:hypothetical protein [Acidimicrobiales bacterium]
MAADPVRHQRARVARHTATAKRVGYALWVLAIVGFFAGLATRFTDLLANAVIAALVLGGVILAPAIILGYAVKAAERDDRERGL